MADDIFKQMGRRAFGGAAAKRPSACPEGVSPATKKLAAAPPTGPSQGQPAPGPPGPAPATGSPPHSPLQPPPREKPPPPIFVDATTEWPELAVKLEKIVGGDMVALARGPHIRVTTSTVAGFRKLQRHLASSGVPFHTFTIGGRGMKVVVSGLPWTTTADQLITALEEEGFDIESASRLRSRRGPSGRWLVTFAQECDREEGRKRATEIWHTTDLLHLRISVAPYRRPPGPPQCYRCQRFGHGSSNCGRPLRCVRCGEAHVAAKCPRPKTEKGVCCNCGGDHCASWRGCPAFKEAKNASAPRPSRLRPRRCTRRQPTTSPGRKPAAAEDGESSPPEDDDQGFVTPRKRRRRPPRNPDNRRPRRDNAPPADDAPAKEAAEEQRAPQGPAPRDAPRRRIDWPPKPADATPVPAAQPVCSSEEYRSVFAALAEMARQLTELTRLVSQLVEQRR